MNYYEVLVASQRYHGYKALTYSSEEQLEKGQAVTVPLQQQIVLGVVAEKVSKPQFTVKSVVRVLPEAIIPSELIKLTAWLNEYYPSALGQILTLLLPATLMQQSRSKSKSIEPTERPVRQHSLTSQQKIVVDAILSSDQRMHLLHGETGSGKTRVYLELMSKVLSSKQSCLLLTPEIGLTPQLAASIEAAYPGQTVVLHSELTPSQRRDRWLQIAASTIPLVIIGPRSALFAPVHNVGLIILDEAHDSAYKQEQAPYYVASRVAAKLAELHGAKTVLGSATPLVSDYYTFEQKKLPIHRMTELATLSKYTSHTEVINLREREHFAQSSWLSSQILGAVEKNLSAGAQSLIFLNRRGSARLVLCQDCGWQALCPRCDVALTYHGDNHRMLCHTCGFTEAAPPSCPVCSSAELTFRSIGTKALALELEKLFPKARIMRFDSDNSKTERLEAQFEAVRSGEADIIVGTQLLAKGLDLPGLGLVGIVLADTGLYFPDYTAEERTYQLISQVVGRADRGHRNTDIVVQTYYPDNLTLKQALRKDYAAFYKAQVEQRQIFGFPPFRYVLKLKVERASAKAAHQAAAQLADKLRTQGLRIEISNPAPAFIEKVHNRYRWQLIVKAADRKVLLGVIRKLPANTNYDIDPTNLL